MGEDHLVQIAEDIGYIKASQDGIRWDISDLNDEVEHCRTCMVDMKTKQAVQEEKLGTHMKDKGSHPNGVKLKDKVINLQNGILGTVVTTASIIITWIIKTYGG